MLEVLLEALPQRVGNLVEADELLDPQHLRVIARRARVQALDDGRHVAEDAGVHEGWGRAAGCGAELQSISARSQHHPKACSSLPHPGIPLPGTPVSRAKSEVSRTVPGCLGGDKDPWVFCPPPSTLCLLAASGAP